MDRQNLLHYLSALDIKIDRQQSRQNKLVGFCPFAPYYHKNKRDTRPSFAAFVNEEDMSGYVCKACGRKGTIRSLIIKLEELREADYSELLEDAILSEEAGLTHFPEFEASLTARAGEPSPEPLDEALYHGIYPPAYTSPEASAYLSKRGIGLDTTVALGLLFDPEEQRVLFPVRGADSRLYGYTGRALVADHSIKVRDYYGLPKKHLILGEDRFDPTKPTIIVEGLFGYAHLHEIGIATVANIGALMGAEMTPQKAEKLINMGGPVYLLLDNDNGGELGTFGTGENGNHGAAGRLLGFVPLYIPVWPENKNDPDQLTREEVLEMLEDTPPFTPSDLGIDN